MVPVVSEVSGGRSKRRWLIVGSGGAGKSTFSRRLAAVLNVPIIHLDREFWGPGWTRPEGEQWRARVDELADGDSWVMDGNYGGTISRRLERADVVVVMETPPWTCLYRVVKRRWFDSARPDLPAHCEDQINAEFLWWIVSYPWRSRPKIRKAIHAHPHVECIRLRTDRDAESLLAGLAARPTVEPQRERERAD